MVATKAEDDFFVSELLLLLVLEDDVWLDTTFVGEGVSFGFVMYLDLSSCNLFARAEVLVDNIIGTGTDTGRKCETEYYTQVL